MREIVKKITEGLEITREDIIALLTADDDIFAKEVTLKARDLTRSEFGNKVAVSGLLAFSSHCINDCTYCGLRASNTMIPRYRLKADEMKKVVDRFSESGLKRIILVSGEDRHFSVDDMVTVVQYAKAKNLHVTQSLGAYSESIMKQLKDAGVDCYTIKFESANPGLFRKIKPASSFEDRMACIRRVKQLGMELGSGSIVGIEGQTIEDMADDILLMLELDIDWAPIVPYLPAPGTPMAENTPMGNVALTLRTLSIMRLLMPHIYITAGQPSQGSKVGFADTEGNIAALEAGANILFVDMTPFAVRKDFQVTPGRILPGVKHVDKILSDVGLERE